MIRPTKDSQHCCKDVEGRNVSAGLLIFDPRKNILDLEGETRKFNSCFLNLFIAASGDPISASSSGQLE